MKKLLLSVLMMAGSAAFAVSSSNIFGILRVDSTEKETLISVPWLETDPASGEIKVCDLVLTSNLTEGDRLLYYTGSAAHTGSAAQDFNYYAWTLVEKDGVKTWESVTTVTKDRVITSAHEGTQPVPRGAALIIVRQTNLNDPIYLYGQYTPGTVAVTVTKGTFKGPAYTLLAPSDPNGVDLNATGVMSGTPHDDDYIIIGNIGTMLKYYNDGKGGGAKWGVLGKYDRTTRTYTFDTSKAVIAPGQGIWYVSRGGEPTFNW